MPTTLPLLLLLLLGHGFAGEPPDLNCLVMHLEYVSCFWNKQHHPRVNYTFSSRFDYNEDAFRKCDAYVFENDTVVGCNQTDGQLRIKRFNTFHTRLTHGNKTWEKTHDLKAKVKLNPPTNLTVHNESDYNLWFYWNQTTTGCVESEVRFRTNNNKWENATVRRGGQRYSINLLSTNSRYELLVRSRIDGSCGQSMWSDWSEPVVWGSNNRKDANPKTSGMSVWSTLVYVVGGFVFALLLVMLLYHERFRIIPISALPKPALVLTDIEDWLQFSKGLKGNFKTNYTEHACPIREYRHVSHLDNDTSDGSNFSVTTDQTDCSVSVPSGDPEEPPTSRSPSSSTGLLPAPEAEEQGSD